VEAARCACGAGVDHRGQGAIDLRAQIEANLRDFARVESPSPQKAAAVAITLITGADGETAVPIFQRTATLRRHAGQMAIPGGRTHDGEDAIAAAIRELEEELGLQANPADVLGRLDDFDTMSGFTITPVVVWSGAPESTLKPSRDEVQQLFVIPVSILRGAVQRARKGADFSLNFPLVEVFAPTAAMLYQFSEVALDGRSVRVADFFQPPWTHR
jgi:8-oxo-dGTP pyrophosphatase MutT (NUDIX family)